MKKWQIELAMLCGLPLWEHKKGNRKKVMIARYYSDE